MNLGHERFAIYLNFNCVANSNNITGSYSRLVCFNELTFFSLKPFSGNIRSIRKDGAHVPKVLL